MTTPASAAAQQYASVAVPAHQGSRRMTRPYVAVTTVMIAIVVWGFWPYFSAPFGGTGPRPLAIHIHGAVFSGWMALLMTQVVLAATRRVELHRRLGRVGVGYGVLMLAVGTAATLIAPVAKVRAARWTLDEAASFLILPIGDLLLFAVFFGLAVGHRRKPELHKRLIVLATSSILFAPAARAGDPSLLAVVAIWMLPLSLFIAHDVWTRGKVHKIYAIGAIVLLASLLRLWVMNTDAWLPIGRAIMNALL